ncbi:MAG TPA: FHA domain-containing protein [Blastocatellia bacterium]|nr:FHA domain-containing protein [Blastocatellia bacterium]
MSNTPSVEEQLREWVSQLAPEHRQLLLMMLTEDDRLQRSARLDFAVSQLRKMCKQRGLDWDQMAEGERESFLDNLIRETELYATQAGTPSIIPVLPCSCCGRDVTPSDLYRIYFGERPPSVEIAIARLILMDMDANAQFPLPADNEITIGRVDPHRGIRPDIDLSKFDPASRISRRHARVTARGSQFYIEDLGSANGTIINGRTRLKPQEPYPLVNGDVLKIGETTLKFAV